MSVRKLILLALAVVHCSQLVAADAAKKPNVILIVLDDFGWADLGCYGSKFYRTPNLDRMAGAGVRFTDAYAACPVCSPTRAALMTGKYPARLHLTDWLPGRPDMASQKLLRPKLRQQLPLEEETVAEALHAAGYATASIGKWHLGGPGFEPQRQGFDLNVAGDVTGSPRNYFAPFGRNGNLMPGLEKATDGEYLTDRLFAEAEKFIDTQAAAHKPFFLYMPHYAVHIPLKAKQELIEKYPAAPGKPTGKQDNSVYAAMIESVDQGVGRLVDQLARLKITDNTLILFTSDNGGLATLEGPHTPATINTPHREGKGYLYEGGIRVPLIAHWPGHLPSGKTENSPVSSIDIKPTILELCGVKSTAAVDGLSLAGVLRKGDKLEREALYWHYPHYSNQGGKPGGVIRAGQYKLIEFYENGRRELFDLTKGEGTNLADKQPELVQQLAGKLDSWLTSVDAQRTTPNPDYVPNPQGADGSITLPAKTAEVHGVMLRYEPLPHKNTLGYWVRLDDFATWEFQVARPGQFTVEVLQGCGNGSGGSVVMFEVDGQTLELTVKETGGFQNFEPRELGRVKIDKPGRYTLTVKPRSKPGPAVMDLRQVMLKAVK